MGDCLLEHLQKGRDHGDTIPTIHVLLEKMFRKRTVGCFCSPTSDLSRILVSKHEHGKPVDVGQETKAPSTKKY